MSEEMWQNSYEESLDREDAVLRWGRKEKEKAEELE